MKNRKTFMGIALLIVVLLIGIGYAAITQDLTISGTASATADTDNFSVVFTGVTSDVDEGVVAEAEADSVAATITVSGLSTKGDSKSATYEVKNTSDELYASLSVDTTEVEEDEYFEVTTSIANEEDTLAPEETTTVTVTVKLIKTPAENVDSEVTVTLEAEAVAAD